MGGNGKFLKINLSFLRPSPSRSSTTPPSPPSPPPEYVCPICHTLFTEPVVINSGHTFDRACVEVCKDLEFTPILPDGTYPDFSTLIPNLALHTAIPKWCKENGVPLPKVNDYAEVTEKVRVLVKERNDNDNDGLRPSEIILIDKVENDKPNLNHSRGRAHTEFTPKVTPLDTASPAVSSPITPLYLKTRPACWSPDANSSSSGFYTSDEILNPNFTLSKEDDEEFVQQFESNDPYNQEQGAISLRKVTRHDENLRVKLCTPRLLLVIRPLLQSSYEKVQVNAIAAIVNLSLEKSNKIKIVRSGIVPTLIDLLKGRLSETQEHAAGAIFSLSLEERNRTAIGVLGALAPLLHCLIRSESDRTRSDSALALYNLALDHSNRVKLVKLGAVTPLLAVLRSANEAIAGRVLLVLYQLAASSEGKAAMLDGNAVAHLVAVLSRGGESNQEVSESTRENCVAALYALSHGSMRFKALARDAKAVDALKAVEETGSERAKEKARRILAVLKGRRESGVEENYEAFSETILESSGGLGRNWGRGGPGHGKSAEF